MSNQVNVKENSLQKVIILNLLYAATIMIMLSGIYFSVISFMNNVSFKVLNTTVHGSIFGILVVYLGAKYFLSVMKFKTEFFKSTSQFTWENFKKKKK